MKYKTIIGKSRVFFLHYGWETVKVLPVEYIPIRCRILPEIEFWLQNDGFAFLIGWIGFSFTCITVKKY